MNRPASNVELARELLSGPLPNAAGMEAFAAKWFADSITLSYPGAAPIPVAGTWKGWRGFADFMTAFHQAIQTERMEVVSIDGAGDKVFVSGFTRGRVKRTGRAYASNWLLVWTIRDRKIVQMTEYHDTQAIASAFS
jgi:ketosteroid isomerase-like protein